MTTLIIARHGNTFDKDDTPTRVGLHTDLPLVDKGREQAERIGHYLRDNHLIPDAVYCSNLQRTRHTAEIAVKASTVTNPVFALDIFDEIDYGVDENQPEDTVIARIGADAIAAWDNDATVPDGWNVDPHQIIQNWRSFADQACMHDDNETILVVTSNGIARFAPHITGNFDEFRAKHNIKLATGSLGILTHEGEKWTVQDWNVKP